MPKRCVVYLRVSTAEQAAPGHHSLDAQEILCRRYAEGVGLEVVEVLRDEGYSGRTSNRPGLRRLYEYTSTKPPVPIDTILVQDTSRMGRDTTEYLLFRRELRERGIELVAVTQPNIDSSPEGRLVDTIMAGINQYQSEEKGRRVAIALMKKFEEGWWPGCPPLGYLSVEREGKRTIEPDPERFALVQFAFAQYATGTYAQYHLSNLLAEKGLTNRHARPITRTTMNELLSNPFYFGLMRYKDQERMGRHEPATDRQTWERCQKVTAQHNQYAARARKHVFLLTGLTTCAVCGKHHTHSVVAKKGKSYYHCSSRAQCSQPYISKEDLEGQVTEIVQGIRLTEAFISRVVDKVRKVHEERTGGFERQRRMLQRRQQNLEQQRAVLEEKLLSGVLSDEAFRRQGPRITQELDEVRRVLSDLEYNRSLDTDSLREVLLFARDIPKAYAQAEPALKKQYLRFFFAEFIVKDKKIVRPVFTDFFASLLVADHGSIRSQLAPGAGHYPNRLWLNEALRLIRSIQGQILPAPTSPRLRLASHG